MERTTLARAVLQRRGVRDPVHAWKLHAREPGDLGDSRVVLGRGTVGEGPKP
jgi:hypothetical protein